MTTIKHIKVVEADDEQHTDNTSVIKRKALESPRVNKRIESAPKKKRL